MNSISQNRDNLYLASLAGEAGYALSLAIEGRFPIGDEQLLAIREIRSYLAKARRGERIKKRWEAGNGIPISIATKNRLNAYEEFRYRLSGWDGQTMSRVGRALKGVKTSENLIQDDPETARVAVNLLRTLSKSALRNDYHPSCTDLFY